jgi:hypothetical protein
VVRSRGHLSIGKVALGIGSHAVSTFLVHESSSVGDLTVGAGCLRVGVLDNLDPRPVLAQFSPYERVESTPCYLQVGSSRVVLPSPRIIVLDIFTSRRDPYVAGQ